MATEIEHLTLANRNHEVLAHLLTDGRFLDWAATVAFYKAVHVVEAVFANVGFHSNSHNEREKSLKSPRYKGIFSSYVHLSAASRIARYLEASGAGAFSSFADYMDEAAVRRLVKVRLYRVEQNALPFLTAHAGKLLRKIDPTNF